MNILEIVENFKHLIKTNLIKTHVWRKVSKEVKRYIVNCTVMPDNQTNERKKFYNYQLQKQFQRLVIVKDICKNKINVGGSCVA